MMAERKKTYGRTIKGELITDELIEKIVREAEEGYDVGKLLEQAESADGQTNCSRPAQRPAHRGE
jgi:hypothetical protein